MARKVLIIEDDAGTRRLFRIALQGAGFEVKEATDGLDAIGVLQVEKVDLIVTDLQMPNVDGASAIDTFIKMRNVHNVPIIVATGSSDPVLRKRATDAGASQIFTKPLAPDKLIEAVTSYISPHE